MMAWLARLVAIVLVLVLPPSIADARPMLERAAHAGRVTVYAEPGLEDAATDLAEGAEAALSRISADLAGLPQPAAIEVRLVEDAADLARVAPEGRRPPAWAIGVAYPDLGIVAVAMKRRGQFNEPISTLKHELAHVALGIALSQRAPRWLQEGFAYQHSAEWSQERIETLAGMAWFGNTIPIGELEHSFPAEELVAHRAYAEAYDFVGFLSRRGRYDDTSDDGDRQPFRRFLRELGKGADLDVAAIRAYGRPIKALFDEWQDDLEHRYKLAPIGLIAMVAWILVALLVVVAWWRRRRINRRRIAQWDAEEAERARVSQVIAPPYVPWPGEDPFDDGGGLDDPDDRPSGPRLMN